MPASVTIEPGQIMNVPGAMGRAVSNMAAEHLRAMEELGPVLVVELAKRTPRASGRLAASTWFNVTQVEDMAPADTAKSDATFTQTTLSINQRAVNRRVGGLSYAPFAALGRGPGRRPPVIALMDWVALRFQTPAKLRKRTAFLVARKIGAFGTRQWTSQKPTYPLETITAVHAILQEVSNQLGARITATAMDTRRAGRVVGP